MKKLFLFVVLICFVFLSFSFAADGDNYKTGVDSPASYAVEITPNDNNDLVHFVRGFYVGAQGNVRVRTTGGNIVTFANVPAGQTVPWRIIKVFATGTSASSIVGGW